MNKLRTKITSPIAKSTSRGLSDTTFFACWSSCYWYPKPAKMDLLGPPSIVLSMRLGVQKQSFLNLLRQNGCQFVMYYMYSPLVLSNPTPQVRQDPWHELCNHQSHKQQTESWQDKRNWVRILWNDLHVTKYRKIPQISSGTYIFQGLFLRGLFLEGLIFEGAYLQREICISKSTGLALYLEVNSPFLFCFTLYLRAIFQV